MAERTPKQRESFGSELPPIDLAEFKKFQASKAGTDELPPIDPKKLDELMGGTSAAMAAFADELAFGNLPAVIGFAEGLSGGSYVDARDRTQRQIEKGQDNYPGAASAGKAAAVAGSMFAGYKGAAAVQKAAQELAERAAGLGLQVPKAISDFLANSKIIKGGLTGGIAGAAGGALEAPPFREGQVDIGADLSGRAKNATLGAAIGVPFGLIAGGVSKAIDFPMTLAEKDSAGREAWLASQIPQDEAMRVERALGQGSERTERVAQAGRELGIEPTPGMLSPDFQKRNLEDSLANTPTAIGRMVGQRGREVRQELGTQAGNMLKDRLDSTAANYDAGVAVKRQLKDVLSAAYAPIKESYNQISSELKNVPLTEDGAKFAKRYWQRRIKNSPTFAPDSVPYKTAQKYVDLIGRSRSVENLRLLATELRKEIDVLGRGNYLGELVELPDALERLAEREIIKAAMENTGKSAQGRALAAQLLGQKKTTDAQYSQLKELFEDLRKNAGLKSKDTYGTLVDSLDDIPPEDLIKGLFDVKNIRSLEFFAKKFPEAFETMRRHKLTEIFEKSKKSIEGEDLEFVDPKAFLRQVDQIPERLRVVLFGTKNAKKIDPLGILTRSIPGPINPSGTSYGSQYIENFWNPAANMRDVGRYMMLKDKKFYSPRNIPQTIDRTTGVASGLIGAGMAQSRSMMPSAQIEGFDANALSPIPPELLQMYLKQVNEDSNLSIIDKAKLTNLANKHGLQPNR